MKTGKCQADKLKEKAGLEGGDTREDSGSLGDWPSGGGQFLKFIKLYYLCYVHFSLCTLQVDMKASKVILLELMSHSFCKHL
jgi:hypothetical protein